MSFIRFFKSIISVLLVASMLMSDILRAMENEVDEIPINLPIKPNSIAKSSNNQTDSDNSSFDDSSSSPSKTPNNSKSNSPESSDEQKLTLPLHTLPPNSLMEGNNQQTSSKDSDLSTSSQSLTPSPTKSSIPLHSIISTLIIPQEEKKEEKLIDPKALLGTIVNQKVEQLPSSQTALPQDTSTLVDIKKKQEISIELKSLELKGERKDSSETEKSQTKSTMFQTGNTIYIIEEGDLDLNKQEFSQKQSTKKKSTDKVNLETKLKEEFEFSEVDDKRDLTNLSTASSNNKPNARIELLKESFAHFNKTFEKALSSNLEEKPVNTSFSINDMDQKSAEKIPLINKKSTLDIEKEDSNESNAPQDPLKGILEEDLEKTTQVFEEWVNKASEKTLCAELEGFFKQSVILGKIFTQDLENLLKENSGLKKITIQDWLTHMGLNNDNKTSKVQILSKEFIQFYELFNQALSYHIATALFRDKIPEEDLEKFKSFLLHLKDYTIDGKLTWKQIVGAIGGAAVGGLAAYALYWILQYNLVSVFADYDFWIKKVPSIVPPVNGVLTGFIAQDAVTRNAKMFIDFFSPNTTHFTIPMDQKMIKTLRVKKTGAYGWSLLPSFITAYYYWAYSTLLYPKMWGYAPFLYVNSVWDNSSRLITNEEKSTHKKYLQKVEEDYPVELKKDQAALLKGLKKGDTILKDADQKEINYYYDAVYHSVLSKTTNLTTEDKKFAQTLHLLIFFLELENFKATELNDKNEKPSSQVIQTSENQEEISFFEEQNSKKEPLLDVEEDLKQKRTLTWREKIAKGLSWALPTVGTPLLAMGARYLLKEGILGCLGGFCWNDPVAVEIISDVGGLILWYGVSRVQKPSIQKNIEELPGGKPSRTTSQKPLRLGWQMWNYVVGALLTVPDFMLWVNATITQKAQTTLARGLNILSYIGIGCAIVPETINTADSLNGSSSDFITGTNRVLSHVYAPEGFRRDKLREINHDLKQFIKTLQPGVFKVLSTTVRSLRTVLKEGPESIPSHLKNLFDDNVLKAFGELSEIFKQKKQTYIKERNKAKKKKKEKSEEEMKSIQNYDVINDDN